MADRFHNFWACPSVIPHWQQIAKETMETSGIKVDCSFVTLYLGNIPDNLMAQDEYLFYFKFFHPKTWTISRITDLMDYIHWMCNSLFGH